MSEHRLPTNGEPTPPPNQSAESGGTNPVQWVLYLLRGRWHWALLVGLILAAGVAYYRYAQVELVHRTEGKVQIRRYIPPFLYSDTSVTGEMENFGGFMDDQVQKFDEDQLIEMAMNSQRWQQLDKPYTPEAEKKFRENLRVFHRGGMIHVMFVHPDDDTTKAAVQATIEAYEKIFNEEDPLYQQMRRKLLDRRQQSLSAELDGVRNDIESINEDYQPEGVTARYDQTLNTINSLQERIDELEQQIATTEQTLEDGPPEPSLQELAQEHPRLAKLKRDRDNRERRLQRIIDRYGEDHAAVEPLRERIKVLDQRIDDEVAQIGVEEAKKQWRKKRQDQIDKQKTKLKALREQLATAKDDVAELSDKKQRIQDLRADAQDLESKLKEVNSYLERMNVESVMGDRFQVVTYGEVSDGPINEQEPYEKAMMGGALGGLTGVTLVMLLGLIRPRLRRSADLGLAAQDLKVLGMLPQLPERLDDPDWAYFAGRCVHKIRMLMQLEGRGEGLRSFVITGAGTGTGKTSLTMALGFSYAAAGAKTLMVDCDLVGGGLTRRMEVSRVKRLGAWQRTWTRPSRSARSWSRRG
jgi:uncharacterized protein involved in exopolysaccharide biosynthesis